MLKSRIIYLAIIGFVLFIQSCTNQQQVPRFSVLEKWVNHSGEYENPYTDVEAYAQFTSPEGTTKKIPLFWNGKKEWGLRFAPDQKGEWIWEIKSNDQGLNGKSGRFICTDATTHGGIKVWNEHPYHFIYQDSTPVWIFGETQWALTNAAAPNMPLEGEGCTTESVREYIDARANQGFNLINIKLLAFGLNEGGDAFHRETVYDSIHKETINPGFWKVADERLLYLHKKGITGFLYLAWQRDNNDGGSLVRWAEFPGKEARLRYARYVIARYSALNVAFTITGEWKPGRTPLKDGNSKPPVMEIAREITEWDPHNRVIAVHGGGKGYHHDVFAPEPEIDIADNQQVYKKRYQRIRDARHYQKPVINGEYGYYLYKFYGNLSRMRQNTWKIAMAGGYFVTGWGSTYFGGVNHWTAFGTDANPRNIEWERQVIHIKDFFTNIDWWKYEPVDSLVLSKGQSYSMKNTDEDKEEYLVYLIGEDWDFHVLVHSEQEKMYKVTVFNPRTGQWHLHGHRPAKDSLKLISVDRNDWVFRIQQEK